MTPLTHFDSSVRFNLKEIETFAETTAVFIMKQVTKTNNTQPSC